MPSAGVPHHEERAPEPHDGEERKITHAARDGRGDDEREQDQPEGLPRAAPGRTARRAGVPGTRGARARARRARRDPRRVVGPRPAARTRRAPGPTDRTTPARTCGAGALAALGPTARAPTGGRADGCASGPWAGTAAEPGRSRTTSRRSPAVRADRAADRRSSSSSRSSRPCAKCSCRADVTSSRSASPTRSRSGSSRGSSLLLHRSPLLVAVTRPRRAGGRACAASRRGSPWPRRPGSPTRSGRSA